MSDIAAIILAAGKGTRMKSALPKVLHPVGGRPMVAHVQAVVSAMNASKQVVVVGPDMDVVADAVAPTPTVLQKDQMGTADAVKPALGPLEGFTGTILVLFGDTPLIQEETLRGMVVAREGGGHAVVVLGFRPDDPGAYGRLITQENASGSGIELTEIVEAKEASPEQLEVGLCNSGVMAIDGALLPDLLAGVDNNNAKGEYYLTDIVGLARQTGHSCGYIEAEESELMGINNRADLAEAEAVFQARARSHAMTEGATLIDPSSVFFSWDTKLGRDVMVEPHVVFGPGVSVADGATIRAYSHLEGATVGTGVTVGPFARLRPGAKLEAGSRVGNFVEVKNAVLGEGAKANHLSYIGDAEVGAGANIGAGTITCNYDGFLKSKTIIGKGVFIGSNSALVAPVTIAEGAIVGAGSTITKDVEADALAVTRAEHVAIPRAAARFRERKKAEKEKQNAAKAAAKKE